MSAPLQLTLRKGESVLFPLPQFSVGEGEGEGA
jgi:hypothetical protein